MPIVIREVISEVVLESSQQDGGVGASEATSLVDVDEIVRRAAARVLEELRREWDR